MDAARWLSYPSMALAASGRFPAAVAQGREAVAQQHFAQALKLLAAGGYEKGLAWAQSIVDSATRSEA